MEGRKIYKKRRERGPFKETNLSYFYFIFLKEQILSPETNHKEAETDELPKNSK